MKVVVMGVVANSPEREKAEEEGHGSGGGRREGNERSSTHATHDVYLDFINIEVVCENMMHKAHFPLTAILAQAVVALQGYITWILLRVTVCLNIQLRRTNFYAMC